MVQQSVKEMLCSTVTYVPLKHTKRLQSNCDASVTTFDLLADYEMTLSSLAFSFFRYHSFFISKTFCVPYSCITD